MHSLKKALKLSSDYSIYLLIRLISFSTRFLSLKLIEHTGKLLGSLLFTCIPSKRRQLILNLQLATTLKSINKKTLAKRSLQNTATIFLEIFKFSYMKNFDKIIHPGNSQVLDNIIQNHKSAILVNAHFSNWETMAYNIQHHHQVIVSSPPKNRFIAQWITNIRERFNVKMITNKNTISNCKRALKEGNLLVLIFDQSIPNKGIETEFFGRKIWSNPLPALLAYKTKYPILFYSCTKRKGKFYYKYSSPLTINYENNMKDEIKIITQKLITLLEVEVRESPEQYLWLLNRFKPRTHPAVKNKYQLESVVIHYNNKLASSYKEILSLLFPYSTLTYFSNDNALKKEHPYKLFINFTNDHTLTKFYEKNHVFQTLNAYKLTPKQLVKTLTHHSHPKTNELLQ